MRHGTILRSLAWSSDVGGHPTSVLNVTTAAKDILRTISWPALGALWVVTTIVTAVLVARDPPDAIASLVIGALGGWAVVGMVSAIWCRPESMRGGPGDEWPDAGRD
jgi:hypothetical protein